MRSVLLCLLVNSVLRTPRRHLVIFVPVGPKIVESIIYSIAVFSPFFIVLDIANVVYINVTFTVDSSVQTEFFKN